MRYFRRCSPIHGHHGFTGQRPSNKRKNSAFPYRSVFTDPKHTPWADRALLKSAHGLVVEKGFPWENWPIIPPKGLESWQSLREISEIRSWHWDSYTQKLASPGHGMGLLGAESLEEPERLLNKLQEAASVFVIEYYSRCLEHQAP